MAVAFQSVGAVSEVASNSNAAFTPALPATRPTGSVVLCVAWTRLITATLTTPTGWTLLSGFPVTSATASGGRLWVFARVVDATLTAGPSIAFTGPVTGNTGDEAAAMCICYSGVDTSGTAFANLFDAAATMNDAAGTTTCTYPAITTATNGAMVVRTLCRFQDLAVTFTPTASPAHNERLDFSSTNRTGGQQHLQDIIAATAGAQAAVTVAPSSTTSTRYLAVSLALKPATVPGAPTIGTATAGNAQASVAFTPPASNGGAAITAYRVTSTPGSITATGASSPVTITGLTNGTAYTFTVAAQNSVGFSAESAASNSVTPTAPPPKSISAEETDLDDPAGTPATRTLHKIVVRARKLNSAHTATVRAQLFESATARSTVLETTNLTTSFVDYTLSVADSDAAAISNYNNLRLDLTGYSSTGDAAQVQIADAWLEIPAPSATAGPITISGAPATENDSATTGTGTNPFVVTGAASTEDDSATVGTAIDTATIAGAPATENDSGTVGTAIDTATIAGGVAPEDDSATTGAAINTATIAGGVSTENDSATVGTAGAATLVAGGVSTEDDSAPAGTALGTTIISGAASTEDDSATTGTAVNTATILGGASTEDDAALAGSAVLRILVAGAPATEDDTGLAGTAIDTATIAGGVATEDDAATIGSSGAQQTVSGGVGTEDDSAPAGSTSNLLIVVGNPATEDDAATAGSVIAVQTVAGGTATEDDSATAGSAGARTNVQGAPSTEDDTAQAGVALVAIITFGGVATEDDSAVVGQVIVPSLTISGSPATESDVALAGQIAQIQRVIGGVATESDLATAGFGTFPIFARIDLPTTVVLDPQNAATALRATVTLVAVRRTEAAATPEAYGSTSSLDSSGETSARIDPAPTTISVRKTAADMAIDQYADDVSLDAPPQEVLIDA